MDSCHYGLALQRHFYSAPAYGLRLLKAFGSVQAVFEASRLQIEELLPRAQADWFEKLAKTDWKQTAADMQQLQSLSARLIVWGSPEYPRLLEQIADPPPVLVARGTISQLNQVPWIAIVGSRKPTAYGKRVALEISKALAEQGIGIISGLAYGIDAQAHKGALAGKGPTWAVMGTGIEKIYPTAHQVLGAEIEKSGGLLTEFPIGVAPEPYHFPLRNRIVSGLCRGVVVVEAAVESGSLITARLALEQNREVFAVPGPLGSLTSQGPHQLIREGAKLVEGAWDIVAEFADLKERLSQKSMQAIPACDIILQLLSTDPKSMDQIAFEAKLPVEKILAALAVLESEDKVRRISGARFVSRAAPRMVD